MAAGGARAAAPKPTIGYLGPNSRSLDGQRLVTGPPSTSQICAPGVPLGSFRFYAGRLDDRAVARDAILHERAELLGRAPDHGHPVVFELAAHVWGIERRNHLRFRRITISLDNPMGPRKPNHEDGFWNTGTISDIERTCGSLA